MFYFENHGIRQLSPGNKTNLCGKYNVSGHHVINICTFFHFFHVQLGRSLPGVKYFVWELWLIVESES